MAAACNRPGDRVAPEVNVQLSGTKQAENEDVFVGAVTVTLSSTDGGELQYSLNETVFQEYGAPFTISTPGDYTLRVRAAGGVVTEPRTFQVVPGDDGGDLQPILDIRLEGTESSPGVFEDQVTVIIDAEDISGAGLASVSYSLNGGPAQAYEESFTVSEPGQYQLSVEASDNAGTQTTVARSFQIVPSLVDTTPPGLEIDLSGSELSPGVYSNQVTVTIRATDRGGSGLASTSYSLNDGDFQPYTGAFTISGPGNYTVVAAATDNAGNEAEPEQRSFRIGGLTPSSARIEIQNLDGMTGGELPPGFFHDWLLFSRVNDISVAPPPESLSDWTNLRYHDVATLRIRNVGNDPLQIGALTISDPSRFTLPGGEDSTLPLVIAPGEAYDLDIQFIESAGSKGVRRETLTLYTNDSSAPTTVVQLAGVYQLSPEGNREVFMRPLLPAFGYTTRLLDSGQRFNPYYEALGEEILAPYWRRADPGRPVYVRQLAAYHGCCEEGFQQGRFILTGADGAVIGRFNHHQHYGQSVLPRLANNLDRPAEMTVNPTGVFQVTVENYSSTAGARGEPHGTRFWPVRDRDGALVPNTYLVIQDYLGQQFTPDALSVNYDFNDNVYLMTNVTPDDAVYRLNVAGPSYTDTEGSPWWPDWTVASPREGLPPYGYGPAEALSEGRGNVGITGSPDPVLYRSYRGRWANNTPQAERVLSYNLPVTNGVYQVRLHFAEHFWDEPGRRVMNVRVESSTESEFDIFAEAGKLSALVRTFENVQVSDGMLTIELEALSDWPAISAIEVVRTSSW